MIIKSLFDYYSFGHDYRLLLNGREGTKINQVWGLLKNHLKFIKENNLHVTNQAVETDLLNFCDDLVKKDGNEKFTSEDNAKMVNLIEAADKTLDSELKLTKAYILTDKRFSLKDLLEKVDRLFAQDTFPKLPEIAKFDFHEAGKCIAFERPTAASFHLLRGTESIIRDYYYKLVRKKRLANPTWGLMTSELRKKRNSSKLVLDNLDYIRINFRNPTQHPELRYTLDEAQDLFGLCIDSTNRLVKEIEKV